MKSNSKDNRAVLFVTPFMETGGTEKVIFELATGLKAKGWTTYVISSGGRLVKQLQVLGVKHFQFAPLASKSPWAVVRSALKIRDIMRRYGIGTVNSHSYVTAIATALSLTTANSGRKHVFTLHIPEKEFYFYVMGLTLNWMVDQTCTVCEWTRDKLVQFGMAEKNIKVIYNGVDTKYFNLRTERSTNISEFNIGIVARLVERKGHAVLLRAVREFYEQGGRRILRIHFYGDGPSRPKLEDLSDSLGMKNFVVFHGDTEDVKTAYSNLDLFVLPSYSEGFPLTILEAMSAGIPVVASNVSGIPEVVNNLSTGVTFPPGDYMLLSRIIDKMVNDPEFRRKLASTAKVVARKKFDRTKMIQSYERLFCRS